MRAINAILWGVLLSATWGFRVRTRWAPLDISRKGEFLDTTKSQSTSTGFAALGTFPSWLLEGCARMGFHSPTDVQAHAIPRILTGRDVLLQAQTGSGKTLAFALPILANIDASHAAIQAVIIAPTRELSLQLASVLRRLAKPSPDRISIMPVLEGSTNQRQQLWAAAEPPHIVVGNPAALQKLSQNGRLRLSSVKHVVVDEVDACLLRPVSKQELHKLLSRHLSRTYQQVDSAEERDEPYRRSSVHRDRGQPHRVPAPFRASRQTILCSATIPQRNHFVESCVQNGWTESLPEVINLSAWQLMPRHIVHERILCEVAHQSSLLLYLLRKEVLPSRGQCLAFVDDGQQAVSMLHAMEHFSSRNETEYAAVRKLVAVLSENEDVERRRKVLQEFRDGAYKVLLCSDLAARGIDIPNVDLVIQMAIPPTATDYLHRAGRTGRLQRAGKVILLTRPGEEFAVQRLENELGISIAKREVKATLRE